MRTHCEARVKKALEALPEVVQAAVSHEEGTAVVILKAVISDEVLKKSRGSGGLHRNRHCRRLQYGSAETAARDYRQYE